MSIGKGLPIPQPKPPPCGRRKSEGSSFDVKLSPSLFCQLELIGHQPAPVLELF